MKSIKLQDLLDWFLYGPNECRTVDSHGSHELWLFVCVGGGRHGQGLCMKSG